MSSTLKISKTANELKIVNPKPMAPEARNALDILGWGLILAAVIYAVLIIFGIESTSGKIFNAVFDVVFLWGGLIFLNKIIYKEIIYITHEKISIIEKYLYKRTHKEIPFSQITHIGLTAERSYKNPLTNFNPFEHKEMPKPEIELLNGTIDIHYNGQIINCAKNLHSWDADEIIFQIQAFTGKKFHIGE